MTTSACMVTAVSGSIEQVGSMIKEIQHTIIIYHPLHNSIQLQRASADSCLVANIVVHMHPTAGYYLVLNQTIASGWILKLLYIS